MKKTADRSSREISSQLIISVLSHFTEPIGGLDVPPPRSGWARGDAVESPRKLSFKVFPNNILGFHRECFWAPVPSIDAETVAEGGVAVADAMDDVADAMEGLQVSRELLPQHQELGESGLLDMTTARFATKYRMDLSSVEPRGPLNENGFHTYSLEQLKEMYLEGNYPVLA